MFLFYFSAYSRMTEPLAFCEFGGRFVKLCVSSVCVCGGVSSCASSMQVRSAERLRDDSLKRLKN